MSYLGNSPTYQAYAPAIDYFNGNGSTTSFTLSRPVGNATQITVVVANVIQNPSSAFSIANGVITFTSAPPAGTNNIYVLYPTIVTQALVDPQPAQVSDKANTSQGSFSVPSGTTAQRPAAPASGALRYNNQTGAFEGYANGVWGSIGGGAENSVFYGNDNVISQNFTSQSGKNYASFGPITQSAYTVTIVAGSVWKVI